MASKGVLAVIAITTALAAAPARADVQGDLVQGVAQGLGMLFNKLKSGNTAGGGTDAAASDANLRWQGKKLEDTDLVGFFDKHPNKGNMMRTGWPRIAMTIDDVSYGLASIELKDPAGSVGGPNWQDLGYHSRSADDQRVCMKYSLVVWADAKHEKKYDDLVTCADDVTRGTNFTLTTWKLSWYRDANTKYKRTTGPTPPGTPYPNKGNDALATAAIDPQICEAQQFSGRGRECGASLISHVFDQLAYNGRVDGDDMRLWIVSVNWKKD